MEQIQNQYILTVPLLMFIHYNRFHPSRGIITFISLQT